MFHAAELESGKDNQVVFGEGIRDAGIVLLPFKRIEDFGGNLRALCRFLRISLTVIDRDMPSVARKGFPRQLPGDKREEIGAKRLRLPEKNPAASGYGH